MSYTIYYESLTDSEPEAVHQRESTLAENMPRAGVLVYNHSPETEHAGNSTV